MSNALRIAGGRTMWKGPGPACLITEANYGEDLFRLDNAELRVWKDRGNEFQISVRHENGTDVEHDVARIASFEGAGLIFDSLSGRRFRFTGVLLKAQYYPADFVIEDGADLTWTEKWVADHDTIYTCEDDSKRCRKNPHLIMPYYPPKQDFKARLVTVDIDFYDRSSNDNDAE